MFFIFLVCNYLIHNKIKIFIFFYKIIVFIKKCCIFVMLNKNTNKQKQITMKKQEFIKNGMQLTKNLEANGIVIPAKKGEHVGNFVGFTIWPGTEKHWERVWQRFGNIMNYTILYPAETICEILSGIDFVKVNPTKSKRFCRLRIF